MKLGIFDSGIGGEAVAASLQSEFPEADIVVVNDKANLPYGNKSLDQVAKLTETAIQPLLQSNCDIVILACNTATAAAIEILRTKYPDQKFIGLEPMIKPAASLTKTCIIAVCATPATLSSSRYQSLKSRFASEITVLEPDCSQWAHMIEQNQINHSLTAGTIQAITQQSADVIVLACTHYHWIKDLIIETAGESVSVIDPSQAIVNRVRQLLANN